MAQAVPHSNSQECSGAAGRRPVAFSTIAPAARRLPAILLLALAPLLAGHARAEYREKDLMALGLEDLLAIQVTSVTRSEDPVSQAAASIFVIRQEDIRRSGATNVPEALRMAPGVHVARLDANKWAVSIRGNNTRFFNKLLVLMDGRTLFDPLHSGVYWDVQDLMLDDVERIEVIRGPGATLWGANAVNGVINIITKKTADTQGGLATLAAGNEDRWTGAVRQGGTLGDDATYRVWAKYLERDPLARAASALPDSNEWDALRGGLRVDWKRSERDDVTFEAVMYDGGADQTSRVALPAPPGFFLDTSGIVFDGGHGRVRWDRKLSDRSSMQLQLYYDRTDRTEIGFREQRDTYDLDFQKRQPLGDDHDLVWGFGYRLSSDEIGNITAITVNPASRDFSTVSAFFQDRITLEPDRWTLIVGTRLEHNDYTSLEVQPTVRAVFTPDSRDTLWASVARAVRIPSRLEHDLGDVLQFPLTFRNAGTELIDSEKLLSYELGYRRRASERLSVDLVGFYGRYLDALGSQILPPAGGIIPFRFVSQQRATARGFEVFASYEANDDWELSLGYTNLNLQSSATAAGSSPNHQVQLRSYYDLSSRFELDTVLYWVDRLPAQRIPEHFRLDARLGWRASDRVDVSLVGQNLLDDRHPEFGTGLPPLGRFEVERSVYGKVTWKF